MPANNFVRMGVNKHIMSVIQNKYLSQKLIYLVNFFPYKSIFVDKKFIPQLLEKMV